jgi:hypothetical protein
MLAMPSHEPYHVTDVRTAALRRARKAFDEERFLPHINKVELIHLGLDPISIEQQWSQAG